MGRLVCLKPHLRQFAVRGCAQQHTLEHARCFTLLRNGACRYKYIYIRSPKAASTTIVDELGECNNPRTRNQNATSCMGLHYYWEDDFQPSNITDMWKDYFVFGFVRNPWSRAYSLFKYTTSDACMRG